MLYVECLRKEEEEEIVFRKIKESNEESQDSQSIISHHALDKLTSSQTLLVGLLKEERATRLNCLIYELFLEVHKVASYYTPKIVSIAPMEIT